MVKAEDGGKSNSRVKRRLYSNANSAHSFEKTRAAPDEIILSLMRSRRAEPSNDQLPAILSSVVPENSLRG